MKALAALARITLVLGLLSGCARWRVARSPQPQAAPPLQTGQGSIDKEQAKAKQPAPPSTLPQPSSQATPPALPPAKPPKVKRSRKKRPPANSKSSQRADSAPASSTNSPIGQLSTGDNATGEQTTRDTLALISQTEKGLAEIKRGASKEEQTTEGQIRTFLKQAKQALDSGDADGALTLATKAKLLLDELTKQ